MRNQESSTSTTQLRDLDLAAKVARLPDVFLVGPIEVAAITGFAVSSLRNPAQRARLGMPDPWPYAMCVGLWG